MPRGRRLERGPAIVTGRGGAAGLEHDLALEEGGVNGARTIATNTRALCACTSWRALSCASHISVSIGAACTTNGGGRETEAYTRARTRTYTRTHTPGGGRGGYNIISRVGVV